MNPDMAMKHKLYKIISGGQTGADQAGLHVGKLFGLETGGHIPKGFKTLNGPNPELARTYGLIEHDSDAYAARTHLNVQNSCATLRFAANFDSPGEKCTLKAIKSRLSEISTNNTDQCLDQYCFDVDLTDPPKPEDVALWIASNDIEILNIAGNSEQSYPGCFSKTTAFLTEVMFCLGFELTLTDEDILKALGFTGQKIICTSDRQIVDVLKIRKIGVVFRKAKLNSVELTNKEFINGF